jgi:hypothetical protein
MVIHPNLFIFELEPDRTSLCVEFESLPVTGNGERWAASFSRVGSSLNRICQHSVSSGLRVIGEGVVGKLSVSDRS